MNGQRPGGIGAPLLALLVFAVALWVQSPGAYAGVTDDGLQLIVAKAIARGDGLRFIHQPLAPPASFFPPLFAMTVGAIGTIFPDFPANLLLVQILNAALLAGAAWLAVRLLESLQLPGIVTYAAVGLGFLNVCVLSTSIRSFPEPMLLFWWFAALVTVVRVERGGRWALAAGALAAAAALTSHTGWALGVGVITGLVLRRRPDRKSVV